MSSSFKGGNDGSIDGNSENHNYTSFPILPEQELEHKPLSTLLKSTLKKVTANATTAVQSYLPQSQSQVLKDSKTIEESNNGTDTGISVHPESSVPEITIDMAHMKSSSTVQLDIDDSELASISTAKDDMNDSNRLGTVPDMASISNSLANSYSSFADEKIPKVKTDGKGLRLSTIDTPAARPDITSVSVLKNDDVTSSISPVVNDLVNKETSLQKISTLFKNLPNDIELSDDSSIEEIVDESTFSLFGFKTSINPLKDGGISKQHWMDDAFATECLNCQKSFTAFRRKHHCRFCGQIFCNDCTLFVTRKQAKNGKIRVCKPCYNDVVVYLSDESEGGDSTSNSSRRNSQVLKEATSKNSRLLNKEFLKSGDDKVNVRFEDTSIFKKGHSKLNDSETDVDASTDERTPSKHHGQTILSPDGDNLVFNAPTPPPRMAIPTTRKGEAVEIPVTRSYGSKFASSSYSTRRSRLYDTHHRQLKENRSSDTLSIGSTSNTMNMSKGNDSISLEQDLGYTDDEAESESEDEQVMSLYTSLNHDYDFNRTESGLRLPRNMNNDEEKDENGYNSRSNERAYASLLRMRSRRKSKSVVRSNRSQSHLTKVLSQNDSSFIPIITSNSSTSVTSTINVTGTTEITILPEIKSVEKIIHIDKPQISPVVKFSTPNRTIRSIFENHLSALLDQCLADGEIKNPTEWSAVINKSIESIELIDISDTLDIKQYVKTKKILGGRIEDTAVIDGIFMTKDVDLKYMPGKIYNPKIALIMFPIEYLKTKEQFISLKLISSQESVYINNIVQRLIALKPDIVVCGESVSGLAEKVLEGAGISVISNVKPQVIERLSRYTKADIFSSVNDLFFKQGALGTCKIFEVRKYLYKDFIKTFLFFTGCSFETGFTMALRGGDEDILTSIKYAAETMVVAKFNERFERKLFENQCVVFLNPTDSNVKLYNTVESKSPEAKDTESKNELLNPQNENGAVSVLDDGSYAQDYIRLCNERVLSVSPCVQFPIPYILKNVKESERSLNKFKRKHREIHDAVSLSDIDVETMEELKIEFDFSRLPNGDEDVLKIYRYISDLKLASLTSNFNFRSRSWNNCMNYSSYQLYPVFHKNITFLYSMVSIKNATPCVGPNTGHIDYYTDNDRCLGLFLDQIFLESSEICDECGDSHFNHFKSYVHGNGKIDVVLEKIHKIPSQNDDRQNKRIMWSFCKKCHTSTPMIKMNDETYCFSFGKYLELAFWGRNVKVLGNTCSHDFFKDHIRYFGLNDLAIRMEYSQVDTFEIVTPRKQLEYKPDKDIQLKVETYSQIKDKANRFFNSILSRLNRVKVDTIDKMDEGLHRIEELKAKVQEQSTEVEAKILEIYNLTAPSVHLPLNSILRSVQELSVYWDSEFQDFEKQFLPTEKDITRITQFHLRKFILDKYNSEEDKEVELSDISKEKIQSEKDELKNDDEIRNNLEDEKAFQDKEKEGLVDEEDEKDNLFDENIDKNGPVTGRSSTVLEKIVRMEALLENEKHSSESKHKRNLSGSEEIKPFRTGISRTNTSSKIPVRQANVPFKPLVTPGTPISKLTSSNANASASQIPRLTTNTKELELQLNKGRQNSSSNTSNKVMHLANLFDQMHFDQLSKEFEREREKERRKLNRYRAIPVVSSKPIVEIYKKIEDAVDVDVDGDADEGLSDDESNHKIKRGRADEPKFKKKSGGNASVNQYKRSAGDISPVKNSPPRNLNNSIQNIEKIIQDNDDSGSNKKRKNNLGNLNGGNTNNFNRVSNDLDQANKASEAEMLEEEKKKDIEKAAEKDIDSANTDNRSLDIPQPEKISLLKTLTNFWADRSATLWEPLEYPLLSSEHTFVDSDVIVREDEPSSLIAFCLSSTDYKQKIKSMRDDADNTILSDEIHAKKAAHFSKIEKKFKESGKEQTELEKIICKLNTTHLKYQYLDGQSILSCKIFYSEQFEAFRKACGCDDSFIQSLSRCVKWDSSGGKSGSSFLKTLDNRFIIKELSKSELESFVAIAPFYFRYMAQSTFKTLTTAIAKIFGFYQIHIKNPLTGKNFRMDFLIMENLFYDRKTTRIFDLKGSMRNRHVEQTGRENEVLLDENMVEYIYESPLFVREHSKRLLRGSLFNDTAFLSAMDVMDYSLVIGIDDSDNKKLYVGIIDCIRTFTWDKKVENWVKGNNLIGGGKGKDPTVVTPKQYRVRFREAMERYILEVPDCWYEGKHDRVVNY